MINKEGTKCLVLTMGGIGGLEKDLGEICYVFVFIVKHAATMSRCSVAVKRKYNILCCFSVYRPVCVADAHFGEPLAVGGHSTSDRVTTNCPLSELLTQKASICP